MGSMELWPSIRHFWGDYTPIRMVYHKPLRFTWGVFHLSAKKVGEIFLLKKLKMVAKISSSGVFPPIPRDYPLVN